MATGSIDVMYSCTNCHNKYKLDELSQTQQLCKTCRKKFPLVACKFCRLDFHQMDSLSIDDKCNPCQKEFIQHGEPSQCAICNLPAAFKGSLCSRCSHSKKKYGSPIVCEHCKLKCAFKKSSEARKKLNGKTLCLLCTMNYKRAQFKRKLPSGGDQLSSASKRVKQDSLSVLSSYSSTSATPNTRDSLDPLASSLVQENEKLKSEIVTLKKTVMSKDQQLLDKDKQMCSLKAENMEREKDHRTKVNTQQRQFNETCEQLKLEIQSLKKQLSAQSRSKAKHSTNDSK